MIETVVSANMLIGEVMRVKKNHLAPDFPTGNEQDLLEAIETKLLVLPEETAVYPGHNGTSRIGRERKFNPFFS